MQIEMKYLTMFIIAFTVGTIVLADTRIPQPLPKGTEEPPLIRKFDIEGHYLISGPKYRSTGFITKPPGTQVYIVYQYTGATVTEGIGFMTEGTLVIGWKLDKTVGASSIKFKDGKGECKWVSNPGTGQVSRETWSLIDAEE